MKDPRQLVLNIQNMSRSTVDDWDEKFGLRGRLSLGGQTRYICIAGWAAEAGWDHLSVSIEGSLNPPSWAAMSQLKTIFFKPDEWAVQYMPNEQDHINIHPGVLHIWRKHEPLEQWLKVPPKEYV